MTCARHKKLQNRHDTATAAESSITLHLMQRLCFFISSGKFSPPPEILYLALPLYTLIFYRRRENKSKSVHSYLFHQVWLVDVEAWVVVLEEDE